MQSKNETSKMACIFSNYRDLSTYTGVSVPILRKLVNRAYDPLPAARVSPRKYVFVQDQVDEWLRKEAEQQSAER